MTREINRKNPSFKGFGRPKKISSKTLEEAKKKNRPRRRMKRVWDAKVNSDRYDINFGVCWMCFLDITGQTLEEYRYEPYSEVKPHDSICPLCGYTSWKGRIWFPFRFLRGYIGNPSSRYGIKGVKS